MNYVEITAVKHTNYISRDISCPCGKDVYITYERAAKALKLRPERERNKTIYKCNICGHYHFTTKGNMERKRHLNPYSRTIERKNIQMTRQLIDSTDAIDAARSKCKSYKMKRSYVISMNIF